MRAVLICAAVTAIIRMISPDDAGTGKYIKYISGLVMLSIIIMPIFTSLGNAGGIPELPEITSPAPDVTDLGYGDALTSELERSVASEIKSGLRRRFGFESGEVDVAVKLNGEDRLDIKLEKITVTLKGYAAFFSTDEITRFIQSEYDKKAEVEIRYE